MNSVVNRGRFYLLVVINPLDDIFTLLGTIPLFQRPMFMT